ncbi:hypothetical protein EVAR_47912_1 [Eumeta japonica]|uniref:Uncharacterized protein n=1 Tax=Eumeta variegata TaxID=151549 RepID=A0A4C1Y7I3_EUMVA|nr:hypothetical protein EVAR_47912_1 [Eumeta japonica]
MELECKDNMDVQLSERNDIESIYYKALSKAHDPKLKLELEAQPPGGTCLSQRGGGTTSSTNYGIVSASEHAAPAESLSTKSSDDIALSGSIDRSHCGGQDVLLSTALVKLYDRYNKEHIARALLDSGSTSCLIIEKSIDS